jgi:hypothetical protein
MGDGGSGGSLTGEPRRTPGRLVTDHLLSVGHRKGLILQDGFLLEGVGSLTAASLLVTAWSATGSGYRTSLILHVRHDTIVDGAHAALDAQDRVEDRRTAELP